MPASTVMSALGVFAEHAVGEGVQGVGAGADVGDGEVAVVGAVGPELVVVAVVRPGDDVAVAGAELISGAGAVVVGMGQADGEVGELLAGGLRIVEDELAGDGGAVIFVRDSPRPDPVIGPRGFDSLRFGDGVVPEGERRCRARLCGTAGLPLP